MHLFSGRSAFLLRRIKRTPVIGLIALVVIPTLITIWAPSRSFASTSKNASIHITSMHSAAPGWPTPRPGAASPHILPAYLNAPAPKTTPTDPSSEGTDPIDEMNKYPPGIKDPSNEEPASTENPFNPFNMDNTKPAPDENEEGGTWWNPLNWPSKIVGNVAKWVWNGINSWLLKAVRGIYKDVMDLIGKYVFQDVNLSNDSRILSIYKGFAWIVGSVFLLLIIVVGIKTIFGVSLGYTDYRLKTALPRMAIAGFCAIFALPLCQFFINMVHAASAQALSLFSPEGAITPVTMLWDNLLGPHVMPPLMLIMMIFLMLGFIGLAVFYIIRRAALMVLIVLAPLAFALWVDDSTSEYTTLWTRAFFALVFVEFVHAVIVLLFFQTLFAAKSTEPLYNIVLCFALLYLMYKIPSYIFQTTVIHWGRPGMVTTVAGTGGVVYGGKLALGAVSGGAGAACAGAGAAAKATSAGG